MRARAIGLVCAALLLTGCSTAASGESMLVDSGQAAVSSEFRISQQEVAASVGLFMDARGEAPGEPPPGLASLTTERKVLESLIASYAEREGLEVTQAQVEDSLAQWAEQNGGSAALAQLALESGIPSQELQTTVRTNLLIAAIGSATPDAEDVAAQLEAARVALAAYSEEIGVAVAPRYGTWDDQELGIIPGSPLSEPAAPEQATP